MSDLMDTNKVRKVKNTCENGGEIIHDDYTQDHNCYVKVKEPNGRVIKGNKVEEKDDTFLNW